MLQEITINIRVNAENHLIKYKINFVKKKKKKKKVNEKKKNSHY